MCRGRLATVEIGACGAGTGVRARSPDTEATVNLQILDETLRALDIPASLVSLGRPAESAWCVVPSPDGWEVYWNAGGVRHSYVRLNSEAVACYCLLGKLVYDQLLAGKFDFPG